MRQEITARQQLSSKKMKKKSRETGEKRKTDNRQRERTKKE